MTKQIFELSKSFAIEADDQESDTIKQNISSFAIPPGPFDGKGIYFLGHSLGLECIQSQNDFQETLNQWKSLDFQKNNNEQQVSKYIGQIIGAEEKEISIGGSLTQYIHITFSYFYKPQGQRTKILIDAPSFPSDIYALKAQIINHNLDPEQELIVQKPRQDEETLREQDILDTIDKYGQNIAVMFFEGVNYLTGQLYNIPKITQKAQSQGIIVGWDLAHTIGIIDVQMHNWNVDFATYCTYKFTNSGPHNFGGLFLHQKYLNSQQINNCFISGYYCYQDQLKYKEGASMLTLSPPNDLQLSFMLAPMKLIANTGMENLRKRSIKLTGFLEYGLLSIDPQQQFFKIITPMDPECRGGTLTLKFENDAHSLVYKLREHQIFVDFRQPNCMRICPSPCYNTYQEIYNFIDLFQKILKGQI